MTTDERTPGEHAIASDRSITDGRDVITARPIGDVQLARKKPFPGFLQAIGLLILFNLFELVCAVGSSLIGRVTGGDECLVLLVPFQVVVAWGLLFWLVSIWLRDPWRSVVPLGRIPFSVLFSLLITCLTLPYLWTDLLWLAPVPETWFETFGENVEEWHAHPTILAVCAILIAPVVEEVFFRGVVLRAFVHRYGTSVAVVASSALFGAYHLDPWQAVYTFGMGLFFSWLYLRSRNLLVPIAAHLLVNIDSVWIEDLAIRLMGFSEEQLTEMECLPFSVLVAFSAAALIGLFLLNRGFAKLARQRADREAASIA